MCKFNGFKKKVKMNKAINTVKILGVFNEQMRKMFLSVVKQIRQKFHCDWWRKYSARNKIIGSTYTA